jgi:hypothetical protein
MEMGVVLGLALAFILGIGLHFGYSSFSMVCNFIHIIICIDLLFSLLKNNVFCSDAQIKGFFF